MSEVETLRGIDVEDVILGGGDVWQVVMEDFC